MKVPLVYPKIPDTKSCMLKQCVAFEKYDGTNLHWTWDRNLGWFSFGTRREEYPFTLEGFQKFYLKHKLAAATYTFEQTYAPQLEEFFRTKDKKQGSTYTVFTEWFGPNSFAGQHNITESKKHILFDVQVDGHLLTPSEFLSGYSKFPIAKVLYKGKYSGQLVEDIRNGKYKVNEGAVIKGIVDGEVYMAKVKTNAYMERLKTEFKDNWGDYWE